ncbi:hypothetical protein HGO34_19445 [Agrobacterium vitis]|uniref:Uncharacterized protein n=1 Tax=Agrobacterium vitis TaxID=373 RepID=A0AAE4WH80_AGRVI|nr:hypothetical protein [Agrobacterium vitis]MCM2441907.1 hypothetical protein [Agrobacterium vitis]MUZ59808.1 hypothetical protein [Agrobacterium vitis]MVA66985.1 hypothetical protein [Agrobacterium vitis]MVA89047.1 hypothetical protein [Agrobacterium vitis]
MSALSVSRTIESVFSVYKPRMTRNAISCCGINPENLASACGENAFEAVIHSGAPVDL